MPYCLLDNLRRLSFSADVSEITSRSTFIGAYEDGTASKFRNVGTKSSDAGRLPKRHNTAFKHGESLKSRLSLPKFPPIYRAQFSGIFESSACPFYQSIYSGHLPLPSVMKSGSLYCLEALQGLFWTLQGVLYVGCRYKGCLKCISPGHTVATTAIVPSMVTMGAQKVLTHFVDGRT